ncbi:hypothetical protein SEPL_222 [Salmonella phage SE_PL]|nr:hypothetical protein [Salmonella enterica subsp. enterica serovar Infantis]ELL7856585.1 hypothetical protein [Salmonella enterica]MCP0435772.1 hypothetical protein [Salmonella enterica subsp. enterica serovar Mbandaka]QCW18890.1 hypothetical protein 7t3_0369 [Salmonella phage 7t3]QIG62835.1 hypothetical protein SEPL_222 [Salmonella phage SE_PL]
MISHKAMYDMVTQFMSTIVPNNLFWSSEKEYTVYMMESMGYTLKDWSWYDGPLVNFDYHKIDGHSTSLSYAATTHGYHFINEWYSITVNEVPVLASSARKKLHDFENVSIHKLSLASNQKLTYENSSDEFKKMVNDFTNWQKTFDIDEDYQYSVEIYLTAKGNVDEF